MWGISVCKIDHDCECEFELELGLQNVRRALIQMLDDFEAEDCNRCRLLKCQCQAGMTPPRSPTSSESGSYDYRIIAPPATALPRPDFKNSSEENESPANAVELWVRTSTPNPKKTESPGSKPIGHIDQLSWPPPPKSIWNEYKMNKPEIN